MDFDYSHAKLQTGTKPTPAEKGGPESKTTQGKSVEKQSRKGWADWSPSDTVHTHRDHPHARGGIREDARIHRVHTGMCAWSVDLRSIASIIAPSTLTHKIKRVKDSSFFDPTCSQTYLGWSPCVNAVLTITFGQRTISS